MNKVKEYEMRSFNDIKHIDNYGNEYWEARELQKALEYVKWDKFLNVIDKAKVAYENSGYNINNDFLCLEKIVKAGATTKNIKDIKLSRYACYLIVQNGDPRKEIIALGQTYFAIQTRKQELSEQDYSELSEAEKRFYIRKQTKDGNYSLQRAAKTAGVKNMAQFHNAGYKGLYNGETADDIAKRKKLRYREEILDNMGSEELANNLFRIVQTESKLKNNKIDGEDNASRAHLKVGKIVRNAIIQTGGTMPEDLPTPKKSLKTIESRNKKGNKLQHEE